MIQYADSRRLVRVSIVRLPIVTSVILVYSVNGLFVVVEFGTGIEGANHEQSGFPHPGYEHDSEGHHGEAGWWYLNPNDGKVHWTKGQPAKPFMYTALVRIRSSIGQYTATIFARL